jgi:glycosyltransferase involved in cell wall biosynthesis
MSVDENKKTVDVIIPVYNGENFIVGAIETVANQTITPNKIIIVDDGSTDNTYGKILAYLKNSTVQIKLIQKKNGGLSSARNAGIKESTSDYIAFLDVDDLWLPRICFNKI